MAISFTPEPEPEFSSAADRLLIDEVTPLVTGRVAVVNSPDVAAQLRRLGNDVRASNEWSSAGPYISLEEAVTGVNLVVFRLPKSLDQLDDIAQTVALRSSPDVTLVAGGMLKYMTRSMNEVLGRSFGDVRASLARQKARVLFASAPLPVDGPAPRRAHLDDLDLDVVAWGGVFAGASLDIGTRAMLSTFDSLPTFETAIDFGCGTGILAAQLKRARPSARVIASDNSSVAAASARGTAAANGLPIEVFHESSLVGQSDNSADLIVLNPPFHDGGALSTEAAHDMFWEASRVLKPGGELRSVWNTNLGYRAELTRVVGPTTQLARTPKFTVTASIKPTI